MHAHLSGTYLGIKYKNWRNYTISPSQNDSSHHDFAVKILFLLGQTPSNETQTKINNESDVYGDVIQESFLDTYNNLTLKTVMMLKWANRSCQNKSECCSEIQWFILKKNFEKTKFQSAQLYS